VLERGLTGLSLRPLAAAAGTSPRVLLYLDAIDGQRQLDLCRGLHHGVIADHGDDARR
jgi:hypothetical protein